MLTLRYIKEKFKTVTMSLNVTGWTKRAVCEMLMEKAGLLLNVSEKSVVCCTVKHHTSLVQSTGINNSAKTNRRRLINRIILSY